MTPPHPPTKPHPLQQAQGSAPQAAHLDAITEKNILCCNIVHIVYTQQHFVKFLLIFVQHMYVFT